ncbi:MAG: class I cytochrome c [Betaproteobacteria bacterium]|nr:MAG: class I cytochrome c [Betaproteobacteria bacterium]
MKIKFAIGPATLLLAVATSGPVAYAQDSAAVRGMAATCTFCHGTDGRSVGITPSLAGVEKGYMAQQMKDYKAGKRPGTIMHQLAKGYTDAQIDQIAAYFAAQKR